MVKVTTTATMAVLLISMISFSLVFSVSSKVNRMAKKFQILKSANGRKKIQHDPSQICAVPGNFLKDSVYTRYCYYSYGTLEEARACPSGYGLYYEQADSMYICYISMHPDDDISTCSGTIHNETCEDNHGCDDILWDKVKLENCCSSGGTVCSSRTELDDKSDMCFQSDKFQPYETAARMCRIGPQNHPFTDSECPHQKSYENNMYDDDYYYDDDDGGDGGYYCSKVIYTDEEVLECIGMAENLDVPVEVYNFYCANPAHYYETSMVDDESFCKSFSSLNLEKCCSSTDSICAGHINDNYYYYDNANKQDHFFKIIGVEEEELFSSEDVCCATSGGEGFSLNVFCSIQGDIKDCPNGWNSFVGGGGCGKWKDSSENVPICSDGSSKMNVAEYCGISDSDIPKNSYVYVTCKTDAKAANVCPVGNNWHIADDNNHCYKGHLYRKGMPPNQHCGTGKIAVKDNICQYCKAGTVPLHDRTECIPCKAGSYSIGLSDQCTPCQAGTYALAGADKCDMCPPGFYSDKGADRCTQCEAAHTAPPGSASCRTCQTITPLSAV